MDHGALSQFVKDYKDVAILAFSGAALVISLAGLKTSRRVLRISRNTSDPIILVEIAQYDHSPEGACCVTARNIGGTDAHNVRIRLYLERNIIGGRRIRAFAKPFFVMRVNYVQRGCAEDVVIPKVGKYIDDENQMAFAGAYSRCRYTDQSGKKHCTELRVRANSSPSSTVIEVMGWGRDETERLMRDRLRNRGREMPEDATQAELVAEMIKPPRQGWVGQTDLSTPISNY